MATVQQRSPIVIKLSVLAGVVAVVGVVIGLLMPAVQSSRRSARRVEPGTIISADAYGDDTDLASGRVLAAAAAPAAREAVPQIDAHPSQKPQAATTGRKIIYDTSVDVVTEDLNKLEASLLRIIEREGAYVADSDRSGSTGAIRRGHWKVRVPVDGYDRFVRGVLGLGELVSTQAHSQDVSAEYYDLDARTTAKKVEESRLLKHLADSTGRLEEILAVERELTRVRSEIEQMQGRLAVLSNLTTLATVTLTASEIKDYVPPQAPNLGLKVARTFASSLESLQGLGETVLLFTVALAPWIPLLILGAILVLLAIRRIERGLRRPAPDPTVISP